LQKKISKTYLTNREIKQFFDGSNDFEDYIADPLNTSEILNVTPYEKSLEVAKDTFEIGKASFLDAFGVLSANFLYLLLKVY